MEPKATGDFVSLLRITNQETGASAEKSLGEKLDQSLLLCGFAFSNGSDVEGKLQF